jgi:hypothetical protein
MTVLLRWVVLLAVVTVSLPAEAGRRPFIWTWDTETVPEGDLELEQWLWAVSPPTDPARARPAAYWIWWGPVIGVTSRFELAVPFEIRSTRSVTALDNFWLDGRFRLTPREQEGGFQALVRAAYRQSIHSPRPSGAELNLVGAYGGPREFHAALDLGARFSFAAGAASLAMLTYAGGVTWPLLDGELRAGAEVFGELQANGLHHHFVGPSASWTKGRLWLTFGLLVGLGPLAPDTPKLMPRLIWAVVL